MLFRSTKEQIEEILVFALEMRRRVKEQLKKLGGMEFYAVSYTHLDVYKRQLQNRIRFPARPCGSVTS